VKVEWTVDDGYAGGSRPQYTDIDDDDLDECETDEEREEFINDCIQQDFEQKITWTRI
jgi:hypothetical protein